MRQCLLLLFLFPTIVFAQHKPASYEKTTDGVIVYTDPEVSPTVPAIQLQVIEEGIIRVVTPGLYNRNSLITVYKKNPKLNWTLVPGKESVSIKTSRLTATVSLRAGKVVYYDAAGKKILSEKSNGRALTPAVFEGSPSFGVTQAFQTTADDSYYGLGQHQEDVFNYRRQKVTLFQNNTEVAIPFLISSKNYGILWDNYSLSTVGDIRSWRPLSALQLFSKEGDEGWLTASYANDRAKPAELILQRPETAIDMEFLGESKLKLPAQFKPENGLVTWEGSIASDFTGEHTMHFTYGGYLKVWIGGQLMADHWRRAWNPAPILLKLPMTKGVKASLKIEWIPEGGESYLSLKWLEPQTTEGENRFAFSSEAGQGLDYYFVYGKNMDEVIGSYRRLTGKAPIVPKWAMGFWQSRERYKTQEEVLNTVAEFRKRNIPLDNIVLDWFYWKEDQWGSQEFDPARFPSPDSMIRRLHDEHHAQLMISVWPKFYEGVSTYNDFNAKGWLYQRNIADRQRDWVGPGYVSTFYDAFNAEARKAFWDLIYEKIYRKGIDAWWMDASEPDILSNVSPEKRKQQMTPTALGPAAEYLNAYPLQNAKGIYEGQRSVDPDKRVFLLTRSGFAGSQRYAAAIWSGDIGARWHDMKAQISAGINFSLSGLPWWTMDIGGFVVENRFERPNATDGEEWRELQTRWYQFGAFVPLFRVHGQAPFREMFHTAPEDHPAYQSMLYYDRLRYRLMPYLYSLAGATYHQDYTLMRGLVMDFPSDRKVHSIGDQFMFGPALLVNPVYSYKATSRQVYLPAGNGWYDLYTGQYQKGGQEITAAAPYERMPVFVREGSILPFGHELQYVAQKPADTIILHVYGGRDGSFTLYEDEGLNYNYEKGKFATIRCNYVESSKTLTIEKRQGSFDGMLQQRVFIIKFISPQHPKALDFENKEGIVVRYIGTVQAIKLK